MASSASSARVSAVVRRHYITIEPSESLLEAECLMRAARLRALPVARGEALLGFLSYRELARWSLAASPDDGRSLGRRLRETTVEALMDAPPGAVAIDARLEDAAARLLERDIGCIPVVAAGPAGPRLVGLVTETDLLRAGFERPAAPDRTAEHARTTAGEGNGVRVRWRRG
jgi:CBS domain-containing protein